MILILDHYDSFVHNLARYIGQLGYDREVVRHDALTMEDVIVLDPLAVILSPGPGAPVDAALAVGLVRRTRALPILGVCLGHQCIAAAYGGVVRRAERPVHGQATLISHDGRGIFQHIPSPLKVGRYHSLIADLPVGGPLVGTAWSQGDRPELMALAHRTAPQIGIQFHPESLLTDQGRPILDNFLKLAEGWRRQNRAAPQAAQ